MSAAPPRWAVALLEAVLPAGTSGASVRADLLEEFGEVADQRGLAAARRWYVREALALCAHVAVDRARGRVGPAAEPRLPLLERASQDVRLALRRFRRAPGFTTVAVGTMALGIGATVAIFSVVNTVLLEPLPYADPGRLVAIWEWNVPRDLRENVVNPGNFRAWRDRSGSFEAMSAVSLGRPVTVAAAGEPDEVLVQFAHPDFFSVLGLDAAHGRTFTTSVSALDGPEVVLSHRYWLRRFGGDPSVVGRPIELNASAATVVGVLPPEYVAFGEGTELWVTLDVTRGNQTNTGRWLMVVGRLGADATLAAARDELEAIAAGLEEEFPDFNAGWTVNLVPLQRQVVGPVERPLWILLGAVGLLLLVACANVANLFLVRATERARELAVRTSLGARGATLARQLLTESLMIAAAGALLGTGLAHVGTQALATRVPDAFTLPRVESAGVDTAVLVFAVVLTTLTGLLFGILPALQAARTSPGGVLAAEGRGASQRSGRVRGALVVAEVAISVVLLAGAGLFARSLAALGNVDTGMSPEEVLVGRVNLSGPLYRNASDQSAFFERLVEALAERPGVAAAGAITFLPLDGGGSATGYWPADRPAPAPEDRRGANIRNIAGEYFGAMGIQLLAGRTFGSGDRDGAPQVVIVNRYLAELHWPGESAIGKQLIVDWIDDTPWEIVGVVDDVSLLRLDAPVAEVVYMPYAQAPFFPWMYVAVRTAGEPASFAPTLRTEVSALDPGLPVTGLRVMDDVVTASSARPRLTAALMVLFAALATVLAAVGLYGVLAHAVAQRRREIGVRVAMGARPTHVLKMVGRQGSRLVGVGLGVGLLAALGAGRLLSSLLFQVRPHDPWALVAATALLGAFAVGAWLVPAARALRVDPAEALRSD